MCSFVCNIQSVPNEKGVCHIIWRHIHLKICHTHSFKYDISFFEAVCANLKMNLPRLYMITHSASGTIPFFFALNECYKTVSADLISTVQQNIWSVPIQEWVSLTFCNTVILRSGKHLIYNCVFQNFNECSRIFVTHSFSILAHYVFYTVRSSLKQEDPFLKWDHCVKKHPHSLLLDRSCAQK